MRAAVPESDLSSALETMRLIIWRSRHVAVALVDGGVVPVLASVIRGPSEWSERDIERGMKILDVMTRLGEDVVALM